MISTTSALLPTSACDASDQPPDRGSAFARINEVVGIVAIGEVAPDEDIVLGSLLESEIAVDGLTETTRVDYPGQGEISMWTGTLSDPCGNCEDGVIEVVRHWTAEGRTGFDGLVSGSRDGCMHLSQSWSQHMGVFVVLVFAEPDWTVTMDLPDGWPAPDPIEGIWLHRERNAPPIPATPAVTVTEILDESGSAIDCSTYAS